MKARAVGKRMGGGKCTGRKGIRFFLLPMMLPTQSEKSTVAGVFTHARKALMVCCRDGLDVWVPIKNDTSFA